MIERHGLSVDGRLDAFIPEKPCLIPVLKLKISGAASPA
jgi:hypothetical protein